MIPATPRSSWLGTCCRLLLDKLNSSRHRPDLHKPLQNSINHVYPIWTVLHTFKSKTNTIENLKMWIDRLRIHFRTFFLESKKSLTNRGPTSTRQLSVLLTNNILEEKWRTPCTRLWRKERPARCSDLNFQS